MNAYFCDGKKLFWDQGLVYHALMGDYGTPPFTENPEPKDVAVAVGVYVGNSPEKERIVRQLRDYKVLIHTSDESHGWDSTGIGKIRWMQYPTERYQGDRNILIGCQEDTQRLMPERLPLKQRRLDWCFAGQAFSNSRREMLNYLQGNGKVHVSDGFSKGLPREQYLKLLTESRIALCPGGTVHPDSFRLYEAIEAGCMPLVDRPDFWRWMGVPVWSLEEWKDLKSMIPILLDDPVSLQRETNKIGAWWIKYKRDFARNLYLDAGGTLDDKVTILMPTSPVTVHPSLEHIENAISQTRKYLPNAEIIVMVDGQFGDDYEEYKRRLIEKCGYEWKRILPILFDAPRQQATMTRKALELVTTPYVFFQEHDVFPCGEIDFEKLFTALENPEVDLVRLFHYPAVHPDHQFMYGKVEDVNGVPLMKTTQFSSRTYLAKTQWLRNIIQDYIEPHEFAFIEEKLEAMTRLGSWGEWNKWRMYVYAPSGDMTRSGHSYGRKA